jgi:threonine dehydrogenase-like Zn-dependent dehydrogenase
MSRILLGPDVPVFITDVTDYRLELAESLGGVPVRADADSLARELARRGLSRADAAFDTSGRTAARRQCLDLLGQRGVLVCVGHGGELPLAVSPDLIATERTVMGSEYFAFDELKDNAVLLRTHRETLRRIITHRYPVGELQAAADRFFSGACGKVVVEHD